MALNCRCGSPVYALGIPDCYPKMAPVLRLIFTTYVNSNVTSPSDLDLTPTNPVFPDIYRLITPLLAEVTSERGEPILEEIGAQKYYIRNSTRIIRGVAPAYPSQWGYYIDQFRCQSQVGFFMVDANGVIWGSRRETATGFVGAPIPTVTSTFNSQLEFASYNTVVKWNFSFEIPFTWDDWEVIPLGVFPTALSYNPPQPVGWRIIDPGTPPVTAGHKVRFFYEYVTPQPLLIPIANAAPLASIVIRDPASLAVVAQAITNLGNGYYELNAALNPGDSYILDAQGVTTPPATLLDWTGVYHNFVAP